MTYTVTITGQGQISIPVELRRKYNLDNNRYATLRETVDGKILMEPVPDILSLGGSFKTKKHFTIKREKEAFRNYLATRHLKKTFLSK